MNILVTGGAGFIGSHLVDRLLKDGHKVGVIDSNVENIKRNLSYHERLSVCHGDVTNIEEYMKEEGAIDQIVHLAALADIVPSIENPIDYHDANVTGTMAVLEFARKRGVKKFIYAASGSCYGDNPPLPTKESDPIDCKYPYALTKYIGEQYALHYHKVYKLPVTSLRFFNVYGPRSRTTGTYGAVFGVFLAQKLADKPYTIVGDGYQSRDFTFISDAVESIVLGLKQEKSGEVYNIGSGRHYSIRNLVGLLGGANGVDYIPNRPGEPRVTMANISKAQQDLKYNPAMDFSKGIKIMNQNIEYWKDAPVWTKNSIAEATKSWHERLGKNEG